jgi:hypothetical protein
MESETTQLAPANAMLIALPAQLKWLPGAAETPGRGAFANPSPLYYCGEASLGTILLTL